MPATDIYGRAFKEATVTLLARVVGADGAAIVPAEISAAEYSIFLLNEKKPDQRTAVEGHEAVALTPADILYDTLQTDPIWSIDATGFNFEHIPDRSTHEPFPTAGERYLVEYRLTPTDGSQVIVVRFRISVI